MLKNLALLAVASLLIASTAAAQDEVSNVIDEPCPELFLEKEMVQGERLTQKDFENKVVLLLFYQRDCNGCEREAMPRLQKIFEKYEHSHCALVVAINTAFSKADYPYLADIKETRAHLNRMRWTMPVLRDLDEKSNELFELNEQAGSPQAVVLDVDGTVHAHDWFSEEDEMERVEGVFKSLFSRLNCKCIPKPREVTDACKRIRDAINEGDYASACDQAETIRDSYGYDDQDKKDADYLLEFVDEIMQDRVDRVKTTFDRDPVTAIEQAEETIEDFEGVPGITDLADQVEQWRGSDQLKDFVELKDEVEAVDAELARAGDGLAGEKLKEVTDKLKGLLSRAGETVIAETVRERLKDLGGNDGASLARDDASDSVTATEGGRNRGDSDNDVDRNGNSGTRAGSKPEGGSSDSIGRSGNSNARATRKAEGGRANKVKNSGASRISSNRSHR